MARRFYNNADLVWILFATIAHSLAFSSIAFELVHVMIQDASIYVFRRTIHQYTNSESDPTVRRLEYAFAGVYLPLRALKIPVVKTSSSSSLLLLLPSLLGPLRLVLFLPASPNRFPDFPPLFPFGNGEAATYSDLC